MYKMAKNLLVIFYPDMFFVVIHNWLKLVLKYFMLYDG